MFENRVLRRIYGPKRDLVTGVRKELCNGEGHIFLPGKTTTNKSRRIGWAGRLARMEARVAHVRFLWESQKGKTTGNI
jgi:hypothetical protein